MPEILVCDPASPTVVIGKLQETETIKIFLLLCVFALGLHVLVLALPRELGFRSLLQTKIYTTINQGLLAIRSVTLRTAIFPVPTGVRSFRRECEALPVWIFLRL